MYNKLMYNIWRFTHKGVTASAISESSTWIVGIFESILVLEPMKPCNCKDMFEVSNTDVVYSRTSSPGRAILGEGAEVYGALGGFAQT